MCWLKSRRKKQSRLILWISLIRTQSVMSLHRSVDSNNLLCIQSFVHSSVHVDFAEYSISPLICIIFMCIWSDYMYSMVQQSKLFDYLPDQFLC